MALKRPKERLHPNARKAWIINGVIKTFFEVAIVVAFFILNNMYDLVPMFVGIILIVLVILLGIVHIVVTPNLRMYYWGYEITEKDIDIQSGIIVIKRTLIPMARVQHVDTEYGPILRLFDLATLSISTAGSTHKIPALKQADAENLRQIISERAELSDEDV